MHVGGHLRDMFYECAEQWNGRGTWYAPLARMEWPGWNAREEAKWNAMPVDARARWLIGRLWNCSDILPGDVVQDLSDKMPDGALKTYTVGAAVRALCALSKPTTTTKAGRLI